MKLLECPIGMEFHETGWEVGDHVVLVENPRNLFIYDTYKDKIYSLEQSNRGGKYLRIGPHTGEGAHWRLVSDQRLTEAEMMAELM